MRKTASTGQTIELEAYAIYGYASVKVAMDGKHQCSMRMVPLPKPVQQAGKTFTHSVGKFALTADEAAKLQTEIDAVQAAIDATAEPKPSYTMSRERHQIELALDAAEDLRDYPGEYFPARNKAQATLAAWRKANPEEAAVEDAYRKAMAEAEAKRREEDYKNSFIGRGLD